MLSRFTAERNNELNIGWLPGNERIVSLILTTSRYKKHFRFVLIFRTNVFLLKKSFQKFWSQNQCKSGGNPKKHLVRKINGFKSGFFFRFSVVNSCMRSLRTESSAQRIQVYAGAYSSSRYFELNKHTGLCIWITRYLSSFAKRWTSSFASGMLSIRWSRMNMIHLFCCERGKNTMNLLDCRACVVFRFPAYVCCSWFCA